MTLNVTLTKKVECHGWGEAARCKESIPNNLKVNRDTDTVYFQRSKNNVGLWITDNLQDPNRTYCKLEFRKKVPAGSEIPNIYSLKVKSVSEGQSDLDDELRTVYVAADDALVKSYICNFRDGRRATEPRINEIVSFFLNASVQKSESQELENISTTSAEPPNGATSPR